MKALRLALFTIVLSCVHSHVLLAGSTPHPIHGLSPAAGTLYDAPVVISFSSASEDDISRFRRQLIESGTRHVNWFVPDHIVCELPRDNPIDLSDLLVGLNATVGDLDSRASNTKVTKKVEWIRSCYDLARRLNTMSAAEVWTDEVKLDCLSISPVEMPYRSDLFAASPTGERTPFQNSEFLIGDVLAQVILPESAGSSEDWTDKGLAEAAQGATAGMMAFQQRFPTVPLNFVFNVIQRAPTKYEPVQYSFDDLTIWVLDVMRNLGYAGLGPVEAIHLFNNAGRSRFGTDWVFTGIVASAQHAPNHYFGGVHFAVSLGLGGPGLLVPYPAGPNPNHIDPLLVYAQVFQHESCHMFWAYDEYPEALPGCPSITGYLAVPNRNKIDSYNGADPVGQCQAVVPCIMGRSQWNINHAICPYTSGQIGIRDLDEDGIPDIFDNPPIIQFTNTAVETIFNEHAVISGTARAVPLPNQNPWQAPEERIDYGAPLRDAYYVLAGELGTFFKPVDGDWDTMEEEFRVPLTVVPGLKTEIDFKVRNVMGVTSRKFTKTLYCVGLVYRPFRVDVKNDRIRLGWDMLGDTFGATFDLHRVDLDDSGEDAVLVSDIQPSGPQVGLFIPYTYDDQDIEPNHEYRYYVKGSFSFPYRGEIRLFTFDSERTDVTGMIPINDGGIISHASPNPFRVKTWVSIEVPQVHGAADGSPIPQEVATDVRVEIYDAMGRRVRVLVAEPLFSQTLTVSWDGNNNRNEPAPSGVYFLRAHAGPGSATRKIVLVR